MSYKSNELQQRAILALQHIVNKKDLRPVFRAVWTHRSRAVATDSHLIISIRLKDESLNFFSGCNSLNANKQIVYTDPSGFDQTWSNLTRVIDNIDSMKKSESVHINYKLMNNIFKTLKLLKYAPTHNKIVIETFEEKIVVTAENDDYIITAHCMCLSVYRI